VSLIGAELEQKLSSLGFTPSQYGMKLELGGQKIEAVDGPMLMISFTSISPRTICNFDVKCPRSCSKEQIAGLIYMNVRMNFSEVAEMCKAHIQALGIPLFQ
jgi:hypothetical protein